MSARPRRPSGAGPRASPGGHAGVPLVNLLLDDLDGLRIDAGTGEEGGLILKRGVVRIDLTPAATLTLLCWLLR